MTKELNETFLVSSQDCPRVGRRGSVESMTPKVRGNDWG